MLAEKAALLEAGRWSQEAFDWSWRASADFRGQPFKDTPNFSDLRFPDDVHFSKAHFHSDTSFDGTEFFGVADFSGSVFEGRSSFDNAQFRGPARFSKARFLDNVTFARTQFHDYTRFTQAELSGASHFTYTAFRRVVSFDHATFLGLTRINGSDFTGPADLRDVTFANVLSVRSTQFRARVDFARTTFQRATAFVDVSFEQEGEFAAVAGKGAFRLRNVSFGYLPDFSQAHFEEAPLLDNVDLQPSGLKREPADARPATDLPARWRALRRLAVQGLDYETELVCLKGEIISRRDKQDRRLHLRYWAGLLYQWCSDFGRSIARPLLALGLSIGVFAALYAVRSDAIQKPQFYASAQCRGGGGDPRAAAVALSVQNAVPFAVKGLSEGIDECHACLYGVQADWSGKPKPVVPYEVQGAAVLQFFVSTILIFLVGLGVRNRFRIIR